MDQSSVRTALIAASLVLAFSPPRSVHAADSAPAPVAEAPAVAPPAAVPPVAPPPVAAPIAAAPAIDAAALRPGEFVWRPERATVGEVEVVVSLPLQRAYIYRGGTLIGVTTVSTGRRGHPTPVGRFPIMEKQRRHFSNRYNNAPMPFMQRLTVYGIALHAGRIPGRPASHGCVRLPLDFARALFAVTSVGGDVHIVDAAPTAEEALAAVRGGASGIALAAAN